MNLKKWLKQPITIECDRMRGVYFLLDGTEVVYVGSSVNVRSRVMSHMSTKVYTGAIAIPVDESDSLVAVEAAFVKYLKPKYNTELFANLEFLPRDHDLISKYVTSLMSPRPPRSKFDLESMRQVKIDVYQKVRRKRPTQLWMRRSQGYLA